MSPTLRNDTGEPDARGLEAGRAAHVMTVTVEKEERLMPVAEWVDRDIEIILDSGACDNVLDAEDAPGYLISESPGSRQGRNFVVGNGEKMPNEGQVELRMESPVANGVRVPVVTDFQVAQISKPLMSVSRVCAQGHTCIFTKDGATVKNARDQVVAEFKQSGGLYVQTMTLKPPAPFTRPAPN